MRIHSLTKASFVIIALVVVTTACSSEPEETGTTTDEATGVTATAEPTEITLAIDFFPNGIHAPYYASQELGYFEDENLDVTIEHVIEVGSARTVLAGNADIGHTPLTTMAAVNQERNADLKAFYCVQQRSPMAVLSPAENGIAEPADLVGKTVVDFAGSATQLMWPIFLDRNGLSEEDINLELVDPASRFQLVLRGRADAMLAFWPDNQPALAAACECDVNTIKFDEYGVQHLGNGFVATSEFIEQNPEAIAGFARAITRGMEFAAADPEGAAELFLQAAGEDVFGDPSVVPDVIENVMTATHSAATEGLPLGVMAPEDWQATIDVMVAAGQMNPDDGERFFTNDFIEAS